MDFMTALDIGASALSADRLSINVIAMNLANAKTTRTPEGGHYRRRTVIRAATDVDAPFSKHMQSALDRELKGVRILNVLPDADEEGMVSYPDINVVEEMTNLMTAQRNYEANTATIETVKNMYMQALNIGRSS